MERKDNETSAKLRAGGTGTHSKNESDVSIDEIFSRDINEL